MPSTPVQNTPGEILESIRLTLAGIGIFTTVGVYDSVDSFIDISPRALARVGPAGIIPGAVARDKGQSSGQLYQERLPVAVVWTAGVKRLPGQDETSAVQSMLTIAGQIRTALLGDPSRGGIANLTMFGGKYVNGTDVDGDAAIVDSIPDQAIYTASLPIITGWTVEG